MAGTGSGAGICSHSMTSECSGEHHLSESDLLAFATVNGNLSLFDFIRTMLV
jgi:hypothetical protein